MLAHTTHTSKIENSNIFGVFHGGLYFWKKWSYRSKWQGHSTSALQREYLPASVLLSEPQKSLGLLRMQMSKHSALFARMGGEKQVCFEWQCIWPRDAEKKHVTYSAAAFLVYCCSDLSVTGFPNLPLADSSYVVPLPLL